MLARAGYIRGGVTARRDVPLEGERVSGRVGQRMSRSLGDQ